MFTIKFENTIKYENRNFRRQSLIKKSTKESLSKIIDYSEDCNAIIKVFFMKLKKVILFEYSSYIYI